MDITPIGVLGPAATLPAGSGGEPALPTPPVQAAIPTGPTEPSPVQLVLAVQKVQEIMRANANALQFTIDSETGETVVTVLDSETGKVIQQIPSEDMLALAHAIDHIQQGLLLDSKA